MRFTKNDNGPQEHEVNMTPFIDVIFQLVLFFVFSMKFLAFEGHINAFLPKNRGLDASQPDFNKELRQVTLFLTWERSTSGENVYLRTMHYAPPSGGAVQDEYLFPMDPGVRPVTVKKVVQGREVSVPEIHTYTKMVSADGKKGGSVEYSCGAPNFNELETYLRDQKRIYDEKSGQGAGLRLTVNFESKVPWQMVVNIVDICTRVGITDFALNPLELEY